MFTEIVSCRFNTSVLVKRLRKHSSSENKQFIHSSPVLRQLRADSAVVTGGATVRWGRSRGSLTGKHCEAIVCSENEIRPPLSRSPHCVSAQAVVAKETVHSEWVQEELPCLLPLPPSHVSSGLKPVAQIGFGAASVRQLHR